MLSSESSCGRIAGFGAHYKICDKYLEDRLVIEFLLFISFWICKLLFIMQIVEFKIVVHLESKSKLTSFLLDFSLDAHLFFGLINGFLYALKINVKVFFFVSFRPSGVLELLILSKIQGLKNKNPKSAPRNLKRELFNCLCVIDEEKRFFIFQFQRKSVLLTYFVLLQW